MKVVTAIIFGVLGMFVLGNASLAVPQKSKPLPLYDICIQEDGGGTPVWLKLNSLTGQYVFVNCEDKSTLAGYATLTAVGDELSCEWTNGEYEGWFLIGAQSAIGIVVDLAEKETIFKVQDNDFKDNDCACEKQIDYTSL